MSLVFQNILDINVAHLGYFDPNNLKFEEIKILGVNKAPPKVVVLQNGAVVPSNHIMTYNSTAQVKK